MEVYLNETLFVFMNLTQKNETTHVNKYKVCITTPPSIISDGHLGGHITENEPSKSSFPVFLLQIIVIYAVTRALQFPVKKLGLPSLISQLMAGLIIGPMLPILENYKMMLFPIGSQDTLATITSFGYMLLLFETGVKMDIHMLTRIGKKGWAIALLGCTSPLVIAVGASALESINLFTIEGIFDPRIVMVLHNTTSFTVISSILNDLQLLNSELGRLALSCSLVSDLLGNIVIVLLLLGLPEKSLLTHRVAVKLGSIVLVCIFFFLIYRRAMFWVIQRTHEGKEVKDIYISIILGFLFSISWFSGFLGIGPIFLPFIFGLATPEGVPLGATLVKRIHLLGTKFLLPIFVTTSTLKVQPDFLYSAVSLKIAGHVLVLGYLLKIVVCLVSSLLFYMPFNDALSLSLLLNCKGVVEVIIYSSAKDRNDVKVLSYAVVLILMMFSICISHISIKYLYDPSRKYAGYKERNIISLKQNSNLKIVVCIHRQHHITPMTKLLDIFYPTEKDPITIDVLHLIELVGRSSPIFISHKKKDAVSLNLHDSYSDNMVLSFKLYEDERKGVAVVNPYTAISPHNLMHEDVCNLALDKGSSIIILPFHMRWSNDGKVEYDDKNIMSLNCMVLDRSPCSVGILVTRVVTQVDSSLRLAIIFLGGKDDREALCLANRAAKDATMDLVIYHIVHKNMIEDEHNIDVMLDKAMLKYANGLGNVTYREIQVEGGSQTVDALRQIVNAHDFIIVGRRNGINSPQTNGLRGWSKFPELGLIGDTLASSDIGCKASFLVVQQQQQLSR